MRQRSRPALLVERLATGTAGSVLVADFQPFAAGPRLAERLADGSHRLAVYQLDPARDLAGLPDYLPLDELADGYAERFAELCTAGGSDRGSECGSAVGSTVIGYCSAAALALRIAARLAADRPVRVLLARPTWPDARLIGSILDSVRAELGGTGGAAPELTGEPPEVLAELVELLRAELRELARGHGLDPAGRPLIELAERYRAWFGYLLAAQDALRRPWSAELELRVYADELEPAGVPWYEPAAYRRQLLALGQDEDAAAGRLADALLRQLRG